MLRYIIKFILIIFSLSVFAQNQKENHSAYFSAGYLAGGQVMHRTAIFKSGFNADFAALKNVSANFQVGPGLGLIYLNDERFLPIFFMLNTKFNDDDSGLFCSFKLGYSLSLIHKYEQHISYEYRGGIFAEPMFGYSFLLNNQHKSRINLGFKAISQNLILSYINPENSRKYSERMTYILLGINVSFIF